MKQRPFRQVDVFTATPYRGNPLAVLLQGDGLSDEAMQRFTDWTHLSEASFILPPTTDSADYRVRIFSPGRELPFAGHPTLGTCHAWLEAGGQPRGEFIVQECGAGLVRIRRDPLSGRLAFAAPPLCRSGPLPEPEVDRIARGLGIERSEIIGHAWCDNGPPWRGILLKSAARVLALSPDASQLAGLDIGVAGPWDLAARKAGTAEEHGCAFEVRAFFSKPGGLDEDPVTGSLNAALAQWLIGAGQAPDHYIVSQGTALGRAGRVHIDRDPSGTIWVGGASVTCIQGSVLL